MGKRQKKHSNLQGDNLPLEAQTPRQQEYIDAIASYEQVISLGPAGTGKTYIAARLAAEFLKSVSRSKVILTRPNVGAADTIGFLPGDVDEKMLPWCAPVLEVLKESLGEGHFEAMLGKRIEIVPLEYIRGRTFDNCFVIMDEAQNATLHQLKAFVTRQGMNSTVIINGDVRQTDLGPGSGLAKLQHMARKYRIPMKTVEFTLDDCVRGPLCKAWVGAFLDEESTHQEPSNSDPQILLC